MFNRFRKNRYGYSRWDGTQRIDGLDADDILNALADDYVEDGNLQQALRRLMQDGVRSDDGRRTMGLRELMERMRNQRQQQLNRYNMASGVMDDLRQKLEEIKQMERTGIQQRLDGPEQSQEGQQSPSDSPQPGEQSQPGNEGSQESSPSLPDDVKERLRQLREQYQRERQQEQSAREGQSSDSSQQGQASQSSSPGQSGQGGQTGQGDSSSGEELTPEQKRRMLEMIAKRKQEFLDQLPNDVPGQIKQLTDYDFMDDQAREKFQELLAGLQQQMMQQFFQGMQQSLQNMTPEDVARLREMIRDLNKMLRERQEGLEPDFDSFMQKYGDYFPGVNSLDDLIEQMRQQQAAMQGIMDNLSPDQRQELTDLMEQMLGDDRIRVDMMELAQKSRSRFTNGKLPYTFPISRR